MSKPPRKNKSTELSSMEHTVSHEKPANPPKKSKKEDSISSAIQSEEYIDIHASDISSLKGF